MSHPGKWEFPGGKVEENETPEECLVREIQEELGVTVEILQRLPVHPYTYKSGFSLELIPFRCRIQSGYLAPHQHSEIRWVKKEEIHNLDLAGADVGVLHIYRNYP